ncbi:MAG: hypothetical protein NWE76_01735 [Candidatus Bathyarchaeota archaeon]|nr:hypothetical protein [Candidatus Bathyarchaeota archaeon]
MENYIIDIVRNDLLIEIQTRNFSAIKRKLRSLIGDYSVRLVYPIAERKWIVRVARSNGEMLSRRRSPKRGKLPDLFDELVWIPHLAGEDNFSMEVLMIEEEEIRCADGKGSWRRSGVSIKDRKLLDVVERARFMEREDFLRFLPSDLDQPFTNKSLAREIGVLVRQSRRITYCLKKMGAIREVGKRRNELLFEV